jgi:hypothetical protein
MAGAEALVQQHGALAARANRHVVLVDHERDHTGLDDMDRLRE